MTDLQQYIESNFAKGEHGYERGYFHLVGGLYLLLRTDGTTLFLGHRPLDKHVPFIFTNQGEIKSAHALKAVVDAFDHLYERMD